MINKNVTAMKGRTAADFMGLFAGPVPLEIISDRLGIPDDDREFFYEAAAAAAAGGLRAGGGQSPCKPPCKPLFKPLFKLPAASAPASASLPASVDSSEVWSKFPDFKMSPPKVR